uniref:GDP-mannose 4,6-dehydratase n=2 Tax=viral metagenome TaxID=1070528 RepID=A0A6M3KUS8_9ZZZZ
MGKRALITGITGQDGSYLAEYLLSIGYEVHGVVRRMATQNQLVRLERISHILDELVLHEGSIENYGSVFRIIELVKPDECYHLAAQSFITSSFEDGHSTLNTNIIGTFNVLSAIMELTRDCKFYFAASSEMFGKAAESPQNELTPFHPCSPYGVSKVAGYDLTRHFREAYNMFLVSGILFNHESPRRGMEFVTRKISRGAAMIKLGMADSLHLGNLKAKRDWGHSKDYVRAMHTMLQMDTPSDYVIATGETHSVEEFCECAFGELGINWKDYVVIDDRFTRPQDVMLLLGDYSKAAAMLGWRPAVKFIELVQEMVRADVKLLRGEI